MKVMCIKDWLSDGLHSYKKGKEYWVLDKEYKGEMRGWCYLIQGDRFNGWFWANQTEYFDLSKLD